MVPLRLRRLRGKAQDLVLPLLLPRDQKAVRLTRMVGHTSAGWHVGDRLVTKVYGGIVDKSCCLVEVGRLNAHNAQI